MMDLHRLKAEAFKREREALAKEREAAQRIAAQTCGTCGLALRLCLCGDVVKGPRLRDLPSGVGLAPAPDPIPAVPPEPIDPPCALQEGSEAARWVEIIEEAQRTIARLTKERDELSEETVHLVKERDVLQRRLLAKPPQALGVHQRELLCSICCARVVTLEGATPPRWQWTPDGWRCADCLKMGVAALLRQVAGRLLIELQGRGDPGLKIQPDPLPVSHRRALHKAAGDLLQRASEIEGSGEGADPSPDPIPAVPPEPIDPPCALQEGQDRTIAWGPEDADLLRDLSKRGGAMTRPRCRAGCGGPAHVGFPLTDCPGEELREVPPAVQQLLQQPLPIVVLVSTHGRLAAFRLTGEG